MHYYKVAMEASTNEGTLNKSSYTFTENGSFTFIATDIAGNVTNKTVTIDNIDKIRPENAAFEPDKDNINSEQLPKTWGGLGYVMPSAIRLVLVLVGVFALTAKRKKVQ